MKYPNITRYYETILNPYGCFRTLGEPEVCRDIRRQPEFIAGSRSVTFRLRINGRTKGLKCFTRHSPGQQERYAAISACITKNPSGFFTSFEYLWDEILVFDEYGRGEWYPVLLTDWVEGVTLTEYLRRKCVAKDTAAIRATAERFAEMSLRILESGFRHGDLKFDNIVVAEEGLKLIDYDAVYLSGSDLPASGEIGTPGFYHPRKTVSDFGPYIDDYPVAVIYTSLHAYADKPDLYEKYLPLENILFPPEQCVKASCELLNRFRKEWLAAGRTDLYRISGLLEAPSPKLEKLPDILRSALRKNTKPADRETPVLFRADGRYGYRNGTGREVIPPVFDDAEPFSEGRAAVRVGSKRYYIDFCGKEVFHLQDCQQAGPFRQQRAFIKKNGKFGYINPTGETVVPAVYDDAHNFNEGLAAVQLEGKYGFIDRAGKTAIPFSYDHAGSFREGVAVVEVDGLFGYIDRQGNYLRTPRYEFASSFRRGIAVTEQNGKKKKIEMINNRIYEYTG